LKNKGKPKNKLIFTFYGKLSITSFNQEKNIRASMSHSSTAECNLRNNEKGIYVKESEEKIEKKAVNQVNRGREIEKIV
jgi:hypothetical protein